MGYRGDDLDLRTPQTWSTSPADLAGGAPAESPTRGRLSAGVSGRNGPIWVDETVLAACNHAFDVALAHRAGEVTLDHLLHALTRIDEAAEALEARGVRVTALRRETATIIASEIPIGLPNGKGAPRRSDEFEEALRLAAISAARHDAPANVDDLLRAMVDVRPDLPGLQQQGRPGPRQTASYYDAPPLISRTGFAYDQADAARERRSAYQPPAEPRSPRSAESSAINAQRIDSLEQMVRSLSADLANERKAMTGLLQELQREVVVSREDFGRHAKAGSDRLQSELADRMQGLERAMMSQRPSAPVDLGPVLERIAAVERLVSAPRPAPHLDLSPIASRLDTIEEVMLSQETAGLNEMMARLKSLEDGLKAVEAGAATERLRVTDAEAALTATLSNLSDQVARQTADVAEEIVHRSREHTEAALVPVTERMDELAAKLEESKAAASALEAKIGSDLAAAVRKIDETQVAHVQEVKTLHDAVVKLNTNQLSFASSLEQWRRDATNQVSAVAEKLQLVGSTADSISLSLGTLGAGVSGLTGSVAGLGLRLETVEKESAKPVAMLETVTDTLDKMHKVTVERYYRRNRLWYWLFGTDDWVAASWPSQAARIVEDLKIVRSKSAVIPTRK